jgi:phytanoyl-CoA hydroxylase
VKFPAARVTLAIHPLVFQSHSRDLLAAQIMPNLDHLREQFDADGFVIIRQLFSPTEVQELRDQVDRYIREVVPTLPKSAAFFDDYDRPETLRKMQSLDRHDAWFHDFMNSGKHVPMLTHFLRDEFRPQGLEWFTKLPYDQSATPAHQDGFYWCRKPNIACGLWIALDPVDRHNACLWYGRGSHTQGVQPHAASGVLGFSQGLIGFDPAKADAVPAEMAGMRWRITRRRSTGYPNETDRPRRAVSTFCFGSTVLDLEANARYKASLQQQHGQGINS